MTAASASSPHWRRTAPHFDATAAFEAVVAEVGPEGVRWILQLDGEHYQDVTRVAASPSGAAFAEVHSWAPYDATVDASVELDTVTVSGDGDLLVEIAR